MAWTFLPLGLHANSVQRSEWVREHYLALSDWLSAAFGCHEQGFLAPQFGLVRRTSVLFARPCLILVDPFLFATDAFRNSSDFVSSVPSAPLLYLPEGIPVW